MPQIIMLFQTLHTRATAFSPGVTNTLQTLINSPIHWALCLGQSVVWSEGHHSGACGQGHIENCKDENKPTGHASQLKPEDSAPYLPQSNLSTP